MRVVRIAAAVCLMGVAAPAWAQPAQTPASFVSLDRQDRRSRLMGTFGWNNLDGDGLDALRLDIFGQFVARRGVGVYFDVPLSMALVDDDDDDAAIGNMELGGIFAFERSPFLLRLGAALPTAGDDPGDGLANIAGIGVRLNDFPQSTGDAWWLRLSGSYADRASNLFWRIDMGVDIPFEEDNAPDRDPWFRLNGAIGVLVPSSALMLELTNFITEDAFINDDEVLNLLTLAWRFTGGPTRPSVAITLPLDNDVGDYMDWALIFQLEYVFPR